MSMQVLASEAGGAWGHPLRHSIMAALGAVAERDRVLWPHASGRSEATGGGGSAKMACGAALSPSGDSW